MRFGKHLKEDWNYQEGFAGRGIIKSIDSSFVIVWQYLEVPSKLGLLWTLPDGTTYLNNKKVGIAKVKSSSSTTHKQILGQLYKELGYDELDGDYRDNVEQWYEKNVRGRIIKNKIYAYELEGDRQQSKKINTALGAIRKHIKDDWYVGLNEATVKKAVSSALFLTDGGRFLAVKPTFQTLLDLPKGLQDENESAMDALIREIAEETGLNIEPYKGRIKKVARYHYKPHKDIEVFYLHLNELPDLSLMKCSSTFEPKVKGVKLGITAPEISGYAYLNYDKIGRMKPGVRQITADVIRRVR